MAGKPDAPGASGPHLCCWGNARVGEPLSIHTEPRPRLAPSRNRLHLHRRALGVDVLAVSTLSRSSRQGRWTCRRRRPKSGEGAMSVKARWCQDMFTHPASSSCRVTSSSVPSSQTGWPPRVVYRGLVRILPQSRLPSPARPPMILDPLAAACSLSVRCFVFFAKRTTPVDLPWSAK